MKLNNKGMSLIEILIVLAIVASASAMIMNTVFTGQDKANIDAAKTEISKLTGFVKLYKQDKGAYPSTEEGLEALVEGGFMEEVPLDPFKNPYVYESPGSHGKKFEICSGGPDGDETEDDDICNWKKEEE